MPRFEVVEGSSSKFWEIELDGATVRTHWGRIGTHGQRQTKDYESEEAAKKQYEQACTQKIRAGYHRISEDFTPEQVKTASSSVSARDPELEKAILAAPDEPKAYLDYGNWLRVQGDPRGDLIELQASGTTQSSWARKFINDHAEHFYGALAEKIGTRVEVEWFMGFIRHARIAMDYEDTEPGMADLTRLLLGQASGRFVQSLDFGVSEGAFDGENGYADVIKVLAELAPSTLRKLIIGSFEFPEETEMSWSHLGDIGPLWKKLPGLRHLELQSGSMTLGSIDAPELRHFEIRTGGLTRASIKSVCSARWPQLERLVLWFGDDGYGAEGGPADIQPILDGIGLPRLKHLGLMNAEFTDDLCVALAKAKVLPQLESLDLSKGMMTDEGARALLANRAAFKHLERLNVEDNYLADVKLDGLCADVNVGTQRADAPEDRFVSVGE